MNPSFTRRQLLGGLGGICGWLMAQPMARAA
jgi:hypothetical protein